LPADAGDVVSERLDRHVPRREEGGLTDEVDANSRATSALLTPANVCYAPARARRRRDNPFVCALCLRPGQEDRLV
jgi:hypothetical protein